MIPETTPAARAKTATDEIINETTIETPETLFLATLHAINARYEPGTLEYIRDHRPDLHGRLAIALDRIDETGSGVGIATTAFKNALRTWFNLNIEAINLFKGRQK